MILLTPPKKLYRGKKRYCWPWLSCRDLLNWAISVKVGDYIATCTGFNEKVAKIEYVWSNVGWYHREKMDNNWFLNEVIFHNATGGVHYCPGGGCALPRQSNEKIVSYYQNDWPLVPPPPLTENGELADPAWNAEWKKVYFPDY